MNKPRKTVLHLLSQRPRLTGSGITLDSFVRLAGEKSWSQHVSVGVPPHHEPLEVGGLPTDCIHPLFFESDALPFFVPGMSDVMPYPSTVFSSMTASQIEQYTTAWRRHLGSVIQATRPDVIHSHHIWLMSAMLKDIAPDIPVVTHCHSTDLRQMTLSPHLAGEVIAGNRRNDHFVVLHEGHADRLANTLSVSKRRITVVGAGYDERVFYPDHSVETDPFSLVYVGKLSNAKGLPQLIDAALSLKQKVPELVLHIAGSGAGEEADALGRRIERLKALIQYHGQLDQAALAKLLRKCSVFALASFYEGVPLVLVEAFACGCQTVCTRLPGIENEIAPYLKDRLELVDLPKMRHTDVPEKEGLPAFVHNLEKALQRALEKPNVDAPSPEVENAVFRFSWKGVFEKVEALWNKWV